MSCCRKRRVSTPQGPQGCVEIENKGAGLTVWPIGTSHGMMLAVRLTINGRYSQVDILSFISKGLCKGATCKWIQGQIPIIQKALSLQPSEFQKYSKSGISLGNLSTLCRNITK